MNQTKSTTTNKNSLKRRKTAFRKTKPVIFQLKNRIKTMFRIADCSIFSINTFWICGEKSAQKLNLA